MNKYYTIIILEMNGIIKHRKMFHVKHLGKKTKKNRKTNNNLDAQKNENML